MSASNTPKRRCLGFGEFEDKCENNPGDWPNPYWCERCDKLRIEHLDGRFASISELFEKAQHGT